MKKIFLTLSVIACTVLSVNAQSLTTNPTAVNVDAPTMEFESDIVDYGTIEQGADGVREFKFTNNGKAPLIISNAKGSCGCTVPTWPKEPIKPGESSTIKVKYDTKRLGAINKSITITSNASTGTKVLRISGTIKAGAKEQTTPLKVNPSGAPVQH